MAKSSRGDNPQQPKVYLSVCLSRLFRCLGRRKNLLSSILQSISHSQSRDFSSAANWIIFLRILRNGGKRSGESRFDRWGNSQGAIFHQMQFALKVDPGGLRRLPKGNNNCVSPHKSVKWAPRMIFFFSFGWSRRLFRAPLQGEAYHDTTAAAPIQI